MPSFSRFEDQKINVAEKDFLLMRAIVGVVVCFLFSVVAHSEPMPKKLTVAWPPGWKLQASLVKENVLYEEAAQQIDGKEIQHLQLTAMRPVTEKAVVDEKSIKDFAGNLRDTVLKMAVEKTIDLQPFPNARGYYFAATDRQPKTDEYRQLVEGVLISEGCLINFTLLTNDASSKNTQIIIAALDRLSIR